MVMPSCIRATANRMSQKLMMNIITQVHPTDTRKCAMFIKALRTDSTTPKRRHYLLEILHSLLQIYIAFTPSNIAFSTSDIVLWLRREDVVDLQSMNILGSQIAAGYKLSLQVYMRFMKPVIE